MTPVKKNIVFSLMVILISFLLGCSHKTLTVFFDGVPPEYDSLRMVAKQNGKKTDSIVLQELAAVAAATKHSSHPPFANKKCGLCHDQGRKGKLTEPMPGLCFQCHDVFEFKFGHGPAASGSCTACHNPHTAENPKLLLRTSQELCYYCHEPSRVTVTPAHEKLGTTACTTCHNPHGGNNKYFLTEKE